jgi:lipopolysaccharide export system permease protein
MRAAGISLLRILRPVFWVAAAATIVSLLLGEFVVPAANRERDRIYNGQIQKVQRQAVNERADFTYLGEGGRIFYVRLYLVNEKRMHEISMQEFRDRELIRRVDAAEAAWDGQQWIFTSGYERTFKDGRESARAFSSLAVPEVAERPPDFAKDVRKPDEMTFFELREHVEKLRSSGARVANYLVDLHIKLSFPLVNLIVVLIGASLATRLRMQSAALGFGLSIAISFLYYAFLRAGQALGHNGAMPPYVAAWFGDMVFGAVGLIMMAQAQRR